MFEVGARLILAATLAAAAVAKLASPGSSRAALATFGIEGDRLQALAWALLVTTELVLAAGVGAGSDAAAFLAAGLMATFAATMVAALLRGRAGAPCACFGARSVVSRRGVARNLALAGAFAALPLLPTAELTTDQWLALGLIVALVACAGLGVAVLALAREVGMLRLRLGPDSALEIPEEGPPVGSTVAIPAPLHQGEAPELLLAVFTSAGCHVCRGLEPAIGSIGRDPAVEVATFEETADADVWTALEAPGSPYAIALAPDGTVLAKGAFNNLAQLESVLATAERRRGAVSVGTPVG